MRALGLRSDIQNGNDKKLTKLNKQTPTSPGESAMLPGECKVVPYIMMLGTNNAALLRLPRRTIRRGEHS